MSSVIDCFDKHCIKIKINMIKIIEINTHENLLLHLIFFIIYKKFIANDE